MAVNVLTSGYGSTEYEDYCILGRYNPYLHLECNVHTYSPKVEETFYPNIGITRSRLVMHARTH